MTTTTTSEYDKQADDFLTKHQIKFTAILEKKQTCPTWDDDKHQHGDKYRVFLSRIHTIGADRIWFHFWNSKFDKEKGNTLRPYDVLASLSSELNCPDTFKEFCSEYGYDTDSIKAEKTFKACRNLSKKLQSFFNEKEIEALQEIQ